MARHGGTAVVVGTIIAAAVFVMNGQNGIRQDIRSFREEVAADRREAAAERAQIRSEAAAELAQIRSEAAAQRAEIRERLARIEALIGTGRPAKQGQPAR